MVANSKMDASKRIPQLDGIRGLAVLMVIYGHYVVAPVLGTLGLPPFWGRVVLYSQNGVGLFFVLSGFLIGGILLDSRNSPRYFPTFYARRFYRIVPLYYALLLASAATLWLLGTLGMDGLRATFDPSMPWYAFPLFLQNFFAPFSGSLGGPLLNVTWSLAVEEHFYLALPLLIWVLRRHETILALAVGLLVFSAPVSTTLLAAWAQENGALENGALVSVYTPAVLDGLGFGVLGALAVRSRAWKGVLSGRWTLVAVAFLCALDMLVPSLLVSLPWGLEIARFLPSRLNLLFLSVLLLAVVFPKGAWARFLCWRPLVSTGTIAYGAYLLHVPCMWLVSYGALGRPPVTLANPAEAGVRVAAFVLTIGVSVLSWRYFESPLIGKGKRWKY